MTTFERDYKEAQEGNEIEARAVVSNAGPIATYRDLLGDRPEIATERPALDWHLRMSIAPILAAYLVLREETGDQSGAHRRAMHGGDDRLVAVDHVVDQVTRFTPHP